MKNSFIIMACLAALIAGCTPAAATPTAQTPTLQNSSFQFPDTDPLVRLVYDPALTGRVEGARVAAAAVTSDQPFWSVHPAYVQVRFPEYAGDQDYQIPFPLDVPQILIYETREFPAYSTDSPLSFSNQFIRLKDLLEKGIDPARCDKPVPGQDLSMPFLPPLNQVQVFCAKARVVAFEGGSGVRYVTYYDQGITPKFEARAFYTFQGLTKDGKYYLSIILPVRTNVLPLQEPAVGDPADVNALALLLQDQVAKINAQADDQFSPSISRLDALIDGLKIPGN